MFEMLPRREMHYSGVPRVVPPFLSLCPAVEPRLNVELEFRDTENQSCHKKQSSLKPMFRGQLKDKINVM